MMWLYLFTIVLLILNYSEWLKYITEKKSSTANFCIINWTRKWPGKILQFFLLAEKDGWDFKEILGRPKNAYFYKQNLVRKFASGKKRKVPALVTLCLFKFDNIHPDTHAPDLLRKLKVHETLVGHLLKHKEYDCGKEPVVYFVYTNEFGICNTKVEEVSLLDIELHQIEDPNHPVICRCLAKISYATEFIQRFCFKVDSGTSFGKIFANIYVDRKLDFVIAYRHSEYRIRITIDSAVPLKENKLGDITRFCKEKLDMETNMFNIKKCPIFHYEFSAIKITKKRWWKDGKTMKKFFEHGVNKHLCCDRHFVKILNENFLGRDMFKTCARRTNEIMRKL